MIVQAESISDAVLVTEMLSLAIAYIYITLAQIVTIPMNWIILCQYKKYTIVGVLQLFHTKHKNVLLCRFYLLAGRLALSISLALGIKSRKRAHSKVGYERLPTSI